MTAKLASKRRWRSIARYIRRKKGRVRVSQLAQRFKLARSNVSRGLKRRVISLDPPAFPWEAGSKPKRPEPVQKCRPALALYFLGLNRHQIEQLLPVKSKTLRRYIIALTIEGPHPGSKRYRMFREDAQESLAQALEKAYGLGDHVGDVFRYLECLGFNYFSAGPSEFLREFRRYEPLPAFLMRKLRQILRTKVRRHGPFIHIAGRNDRLVKVRASRRSLKFD
jgi:hypothetical protein